MKMESHIDESLQLLERAIEQKKQELKEQIFKPKYSSLMKVVGLKSLLTPRLFQNILTKSRKMSHMALSQFEEEIHDAPWRFLGKVGLVSLGIGVMLGSYCKEALGKREEKNV
jgi:hypothetical protein